MLKYQVKKNKLRGLRNSYQITQQELAKSLNLSTASYNKKELNQGTFKLKEMKLILKYFNDMGLNLTLDDIWGED